MTEDTANLAEAESGSGQTLSRSERKRQKTRAKIISAASELMSVSPPAVPSWIPTVSL